MTRLFRLLLSAYALIAASGGRRKAGQRASCLPFFNDTREFLRAVDLCWLAFGLCGTLIFSYALKTRVILSNMKQSVSSSIFVFAATHMLGLLLAGSADAIPAPLQVRPGRISPPLQSGEMIGGLAADEFSLLGISDEGSMVANQGERFVLAYGDRFGKPQQGEPGYFHVSLDREARRIVIDLAQVHSTAVDPEKLASIVAQSKLIASSEMTMDPADGSTNITLLLKRPVKLKIASSKSNSGTEPARVIIEFSAVQADGAFK